MAEAHEPGPGRRNPQPAKVATDHAQNVRLGGGLLISVAFISRTVGVLILASFANMRLVHLAGGLLEQFRIKDRRADFIGSARPLAQVDEATAVAAGGEMLIAAQYNRPAGRASKTDYLFSRHSNTKLKDACHQIIVVRFGDFATIKLAWSECIVIAKVVDEDLAVDLGSMKWGTSFPEQIGFFRWTFSQNIELAADQFGFHLPADLFLDLHQFLASSLDLMR